MWIVRKVVALVLVVAFLAMFAFQKGSEVEVECGPHVTYSATYQGIKHAGSAGDFLHHLADGGWTPLDVYRTVKGMFDTVELWWAVLRSHALGDPAPELAGRWQNQQEADAQAAVAACCPALPATTQPDPGVPPSTEPNPLDGLSGEQLLRQAAMRYWPADEVPTAVAVGMAESGGNPKAHNDYGQGVDGLWQINRQAHLNLIAGKNLQDPSVNAALAFKIWQQAGVVNGQRVAPGRWTPWTTWTSGSYRKYLRPSSSVAAAAVSRSSTSGSSGTTGTQSPDSLGSSADSRPGTFTPDTPAATPDATGPQAGCSAGAMPPAKIITWNSFHGSRYPNQSHGNDGRVVAGMLALAKSGNIIGSQELSDPDRKAAVNAAMDKIGWAFVATHTSHPIYFDRAVWKLVSDDTTEVYERGDAIEGNDQGDRYVVTAVLRSNETGQLLTVINMHQLPHIQKHGILNPKQPKRTSMAVAAWRVMATAVAKHKQDSAVVVVGDMNYDGDPNGMYRAAGLTMASQVFGGTDTLRKREIDQILFTAGAPVREVILGRFGSDHAARMVEFSGSAPAAALSAAVAGSSPASFNFPGQNTVDQAMQWYAAHDGDHGWGGRCLAAVGRAYGHPGTTPVAGHFYATGQWDAMPARYRHTDGSTPPRGALVFWKTGSAAGHIAVSAGGGKVWTTDPPGDGGGIGLVDIDTIDSWGPRLGWSEPYFIGKTRSAA